jgi:tetratricopeptide (TPR) repeat protein
MKAKFEKLMVLVVLLAMGLSTGVTNAKLVAYFELDGNAKDSVGSNHGTLVGNLNWETGRIGGALLFDGGGYVVLANEFNFDFTDAMSVACWIKVTAFDKQWQAIVTKGDNSWRLSRENFENNLAFHCTGVTSNNNGLHSNFGVEGNVNVNDDQWHHVAGVYDGSRICLYVDGILDRSLEASGKIAKGNYKVHIGDNAQMTGRRFRGLIDDMVIFDHSLTEDQVAQLHRLGGASFTSEPTLLKLLGAVRKAETMVKEQKSQEAIALLKKTIDEYEQGSPDDPNDVRPAHKVLFCDLCFLLAKAKEATGAPKADITRMYKRAIESGMLSSPKQGPTLLWLYENTSADEYDNIVEPLIQNSDNYLKEVAIKAETMVREQQSRAAIKFLEGNLAAYTHWRQKHPFDDVVAECGLPEIYFQLAKAKETVDASKKDIADAYCKTFNPSHFDYVLQRSAALIWLLENERTNEWPAVIKSFTQSRDVKDCFKNIVANVCNYFELKKNWAKYEQLLDTLFAEAKYPYDWTVFVESYLIDKTNRWAKEYYNYLDSRPRLKFGRDCLVAKRYAADEKFKQAAELYRDILKRCGPEDDRGEFEFQLCRCLFHGGQYREAVAKLESFIANNKATHRSLVKEAMMMKGRAHVQLGEIDKAIDVFFAVMIEYPETKEAPETNFFVGYCYMLQGKFDQATAAFDLVAQDYPSSSYASKARMCLIRIEKMTQ